MTTTTQSMVYTFPSTGITLNQILEKIGVRTEQRDGKKYLIHNCREIPRPPHDKIEEILKRDFNITILYN